MRSAGSSREGGGASWRPRLGALWGIALKQCRQIEQKRTGDWRGGTRPQAAFNGGTECVAVCNALSGTDLKIESRGQQDRIQPGHIQPCLRRPSTKRRCDGFAGEIQIEPGPDLGSIDGERLRQPGA